MISQQRGEHRSSALAVRVASTTVTYPIAPPADRAALDRIELAAAWAALSHASQEPLALAVFERLTAHQAGQVLGISATAFRLRLMRARRALRASLNAPTSLPIAPPTATQGTNATAGTIAAPPPGPPRPPLKTTYDERTVQP